MDLKGWRRKLALGLAAVALGLPAAGQAADDAPGDAVSVAVGGATEVPTGAALLETYGVGAAGDAGGVEHPVYHLRPEAFSEEGALQLALDELLELAVANNIGLKLEHFAVEKGHYSVDQTYYAFDPSLSASLGYSRRKTGGVSAAAGGGVSGSESLSGGFSLNVPREYGDAFQFRYDVSRASYSLLGTTGDTTIPTTYGAGYTFSYSRPLARGAGRYVNRIPRYMASNSLVLAYDRLDDEVRNLKKSVLDTFFLAVAARQMIDVREAGLERSLKQLEYAVERYKVGLAIQADVLQAENSVLVQRSQLLQARNAHADLLDQLTVLIGLPQELTLAVDAQGALLELGGRLPDDLWSLVQSNSYELKSLNTQLANLRLSRDQLCDRLKPELGLTFSYGRTGEDETLGHAVTGYENESYQAGLSFAKTPGERSTRAGLAQAELDLAGLELSIQQAELQLKARLRTYQRDLATKHQQIMIAQGAADVVRETYNITVERRNVGLAKTLDVVEAQENLLGAELAVLEAQVAYQQAYREIQLMAGLI